jgi:uncharacterized coiled-coil DUF342 family protein
LTGTTALLAALVGVSKFVGNPAGLISTGLGLIVLAGAVKILVTAVEDLSEFDWEELAKGLVGVGALLGSLALFTRFAAVGKGAMAQGAGIILLATGLKILATVVKDFAEMDWNEIGRGLAAMGGGLVLMAGALKLLPPNTLLSAAGIFVVAGSLSLMGLALENMAKMQWDEIGRGLTVMAAGLVAIAGALKFLPPNTLMSAAGVLLVAGSLNLIAIALQSMGEMSWEEIGKGLLVMAGSLGIIAGAMFLMTAALPGAQALIVISAALLLLVPVMQAFAAMSLAEIGQGLLMLAGVFAVIGVAGLLLTPVVPVILALGTAILVLGAGMLAAGLGVAAFASALTVLAAAGAAGAAAVVGIVAGLIGLIPEVMKQIGLGLIAFAKVIQTAGPAITEAIVVVLLALMGAIEKTAPKIISTLLKMLTMMLQALANYVPKMVDAGLKLLTGILRGIANNIGKIIDEATRVAVNFLNGIARNLPKIIDSGFKLIISFIQGLRKAIDANATTMGREGGKLAVALIKGMVKGIMAGAGEIIGAVKNLGSQALSGIKDVLGINSPSKEFEKVGKWVIAGFRQGLDSNKKDIDSAFFTLKDALRALMKESGEDIDKLEAKLKKLQNARRRDIKAINETKEALKQARLEKKQSSEAYTELTKNLNDERIALGKLANDYDKVTTKLQNAQQKLADAIKTRDDYNKAVKEQYSDMASATGDTKVADYIKNLTKQIEDTKTFANAIQRLRALGLNDEMYKDLLATGISALPFVQELLRGGRSKVDEINKLGKQLDEAGATLGKSASTALYEAAVQSAKGLVKGLQNEQKNIEKEMDKIADAMVKSIKKKLGIKSPSRVFMGIGKFTIEGLVNALDAGKSAVEKSSEATGQAAIDSMRKSLTGFSDLIAQDIDDRPTITPVLDLSSVKRGARSIGGMFTGAAFSVDSAYSKAVQAHAGYMSNRNAAAQTDERSVSAITYNQYNTSPKALSEAEIYRQTKNQLSVRKGE